MVRVYVARHPTPTQSKGDWEVRLGRPSGRGSKKISSHQLKSEAIQRARSAARGRKDQGATLYIQGASGRPKKEAEYGGGH